MKAYLNEQLWCCKRDSNPHDLYAIVVIKGDAIVGHVPQQIFDASYLFLKRENSIILANHVYLPITLFPQLCTHCSLQNTFVSWLFDEVVHDSLFLRCQQKDNSLVTLISHEMYLEEPSLIVLLYMSTCGSRSPFLLYLHVCTSHENNIVWNIICIFSLNCKAQN